MNTDHALTTDRVRADYALTTDRVRADYALTIRRSGTPTTR